MVHDNVMQHIPWLVLLKLVALPGDILQIVQNIVSCNAFVVTLMIHH